MHANAYFHKEVFLKNCTVTLYLQLSSVHLRAFCCVQSCDYFASEFVFILLVYSYIVSRS